ncbi:MAG: acyl-CoA dehydrogenase family protein [Pseudomonadota bacterium]
MDFSHSEIQQLLHDSVSKFVTDNGGVEAHRALDVDKHAFDDSVWQQFAELGWLAAPFAEQYGGLEAGSADLMVITEALGKGLLSEPFLGTVVCCGGFLRNSGTEEQQSKYIPGITDGSKQWAFAFAELSSGYNLAAVGVTAEGEGNVRLNGEKIAVVNGEAADYFVVTARTLGRSTDTNGISLFVVDASLAGVSRECYTTVDGRRAATVRFDNVEVNADCLLGERDNAYQIVEAQIDETIVAMGGEAVGTMQMLLDATVEYTKTREQFGQAISNFQVLQHRMVDMYLRLEETRSLLFDAAIQVDNKSHGAAKACAALKVKLCEAGRFVSQQALQLHGGIGMTDELSVSHYFKRLQVLALMFGDEDYYIEKYASID